MKIEVDDSKKNVEIWLAKSEKGLVVNDIIQQYKSSKYTIAIFRSGTQDLVNCTRALLAHNI